jgi:hypothetical protein
MDNITHDAAIPITKRIPRVERKIGLRYAVLVNDMLNDFVHGKLKSNRAKMNDYCTKL